MYQITLHFCTAVMVDPNKFLNELLKCRGKPLTHPQKAIATEVKYGSCNTPQ